jgi:hypothetical protein
VAILRRFSPHRIGELQFRSVVLLGWIQYLSLEARSELGPWNRESIDLGAVTRGGSLLHDCGPCTMRLDDLDLGVIFLQARLKILARSETTDKKYGLELVRNACIGAFTRPP